MKLPDCLGVPVVYEPTLRSVTVRLHPSRWWWPWRFEASPGISDSRGLGRRKKIFVGAAFTNFPAREQQAILLHEVGHAKFRHVEQRMMRFWMILFKPMAFADLAVRQEHEADAFARSCGFGHDLARALSRCGGEGGAMHPRAAERIARLTSQF